MCAIPTQGNEIFLYSSSGKIQSVALGHKDRRPRKFTLMSSNPHNVLPVQARDIYREKILCRYFR